MIFTIDLGLKQIMTSSRSVSRPSRKKSAAPDP